MFEVLLITPGKLFYLIEMQDIVLRVIGQTLSPSTTLSRART